MSDKGDAISIMDDATELMLEIIYEFKSLSIF